jgi:hypothetical protein
MRFKGTGTKDSFLTVLNVSNFVGSNHSTVRKTPKNVKEFKIFVGLQLATVPRNTFACISSAVYQVRLKYVKANGHNHYPLIILCFLAIT